jgi:hypothetical protein
MDLNTIVLSLMNDWIIIKTYSTRFSVIISADIIYRVMQKSEHTVHPRLQSCINVEGGHFEYLKLKSI